jgi:hypothetical protein
MAYTKNLICNNSLTFIIVNMCLLTNCQKMYPAACGPQKLFCTLLPGNLGCTPEILYKSTKLCCLLLCNVFAKFEQHKITMKLDINNKHMTTIYKIIMQLRAFRHWRNIQPLVYMQFSTRSRVCKTKF